MGTASEVKSFLELIKEYFPKLVAAWKQSKKKRIQVIIIASLVLVIGLVAIVFWLQNRITISQVSIDYKEIILSPGETTELHATVLLSNNKQNSKVTWSSNNPSVVSVDKFGVITAVEKGTAEITAQASRFGKSERAVCTVNVRTGPTGYSILLSTDTASTTEIVKVYVNTKPNDEVTNITICAVSPSGEVFTRQLSDDGYYFYTETGKWTIYAVIENSEGSYTGSEPDEIAYLDVSGTTYETMDDLPGILFNSYGDILSGMLGNQ